MKIRTAGGWIVAATVLVTGIALVRSAPSPPARVLPREHLSARLELATLRPGHLRLAAIGDLHGRGQSIANALRRENARTPLDGVLVLGDNFDGCGVGSTLAPEWKGLEPLLGLGLPLFPILGNHDYGNPKRRHGQVRVCGDPNPATQLARRVSDPNWIFPARNYVLATPVADIVMVDTTPLALRVRHSLLGSGSSRQISTFTAATLQLSTAPWKIVAGHHNALHSGVERWTAGATRRNMNAFADVATRNGVHVYLSGHQHHLETLRDGNGPLFVISGAAASPRHPDTLRRTDRRSLYASAQQGYAVLEITADSLEVSLHAADGRLLVRSSAGR